MIQTESLRVIVYRYWHAEGTAGMNGWFESDVYAIRDNEFLVYDDGSGGYPDESITGFCWVDFTEDMPGIGCLYEGAEFYVPVVQLVKDSKQ